MATKRKPKKGKRGGDRRTGMRKAEPETTIKAIRKHRGLLVLAAKSLGVSPATVRNYVRENPAVAEALRDARGELLDVAESKLYEAMDDREPWAVCFLLKTRAKGRGYVERRESRNENRTLIQREAGPILDDETLRRMPVEMQRGFLDMCRWLEEQQNQPTREVIDVQPIAEVSHAATQTNDERDVHAASPEERQPPVEP